MAAPAHTSRTFVVDDAFGLGDLAILGASAVVANHGPVSEFETVYFDTPDLRLARWGVMLRRRGDRRRLEWHLELPGIATDISRVRRSGGGRPGGAGWEPNSGAGDVRAGGSRLEPESGASGGRGAGASWAPGGGPTVGRRGEQGPAFGAHAGEEHGEGTEDVPAELTALVFARTGGAPLVRVARLHATRHHTTLTTARGVLIATVVDDRVSVVENPAPEPNAGWRELSIDAPGADPAVVAAFERRVARRHGERATPRSELERALGPAVRVPVLSPPPAVRSSRVRARVCLVHWLRRQTQELVARDIEVRLGRTGAERAMGVAVRSLDAAVRLYGPLLDAGHLQSLVGELAWLEDLLGSVTTAEAMRLRFERDLEALEQDDVVGPVRASLEGAGTSDSRQARSALLSAMHTDRYGELIDHLVAWAMAPPVRPRAERRLRAVAPGLIRPLVKRLRRSVRLAGRTRGPSRHRTLLGVHASLTDARYAVASLVPAYGRPARRLARRLTAMDETLADMQVAEATRRLLRDLGTLAGGRAGEGGYTYGVMAAREAKRVARRSRRFFRHWRRARPSTRWAGVR